MRAEEINQVNNSPSFTDSHSLCLPLSHSHPDSHPHTLTVMAGGEGKVSRTCSLWLIQNLRNLFTQIRNLSKPRLQARRSTTGWRLGGVEGRTYPVSLAVKQRLGLVKHLLQGLVLGDALGKGRSVGVNLHRGTRPEVSGGVLIARGRGTGASAGVLDAPFSYFPLRPFVSVLVGRSGT